MPDKANPRDLSGTIVAFDFGLARIGAAVGNTLSRSARPVRIFPARTNADKWGGVEAILREWVSRQSGRAYLSAQEGNVRNSRIGLNDSPVRLREGFLFLCIRSMSGSRPLTWNRAG